MPRKQRQSVVPLCNPDDFLLRCRRFFLLVILHDHRMQLSKLCNGCTLHPTRNEKSLLSALPNGSANRRLGRSHTVLNPNAVAISRG